MATAKQISKTLDLWNAEFQDHNFTKWKNFLIKRHGPLIFGICLDKKRDPKYYTPIFFIHNLLNDNKCLFLTYATTAARRGFAMRLKFEEDISAAASSLRENTPILGKKIISFEDFISHVFHSHVNYQYFGRQYLPALISDIIITGCYVGCEEYFLPTLPEAKIKISNAINKTITMVESVEDWALDTKNKALLANNEQILIAISQLGLPDLKDEGLLCNNCNVDYLSRI